MTGGLATAAIGAIALLMVGASFAGATTLLPAYKGINSPFEFQYISGCASGKVTKTGTFNFKTGKGGSGLESAKATSCNGFIGAVGGSAQLNIGVTTYIDLKLPTGVLNVTPTVDAAMTGAGSISFAGTCPTAPFNYSYNYSYGSSYALWINQTGVQGYCYVGANDQMNEYIELDDITNGTQIPVTYGTGCTGNFGFECLVQLPQSYAYNYTDILYNYVDNFTVYSSGSWYYSNYSCANCNSSGGTSYTSFSTPSTATASPSFVYNFLRNHIYALQVEWYSSPNVYATGFLTGSASATINAATLGNGVSIPVISET